VVLDPPVAGRERRVLSPLLAAGLEPVLAHQLVDLALCLVGPELVPSQLAGLEVAGELATSLAEIAGASAPVARSRAAVLLRSVGCPEVRRCSNAGEDPRRRLRPWFSRPLRSDDA
jgi:hypothetical protein